METNHIVALLIAERDRLNRAIGVLQGPTKRRGRPPKSAVTATAAPTSAPAAAPARKKRKFTPAQRKEQAVRMRKYWDAKKKG
jgi:hypothetical protein